MFKRIRKELETSYDRRRALMNNRLMCMILAGVLLYTLIQGILDKSAPTPLWFIIVMSALIIGTGLVFLWNVKMVREFDIKQAEAAELEQKKILEGDMTEERLGEDEAISEEEDSDI